MKEIKMEYSEYEDMVRTIDIQEKTIHDLKKEKDNFIIVNNTYGYTDVFWNDIIEILSKEDTVNILSRKLEEVNRRYDKLKVDHSSLIRTMEGVMIENIELKEKKWWQW